MAVIKVTAADIVADNESDVLSFTEAINIVNGSLALEALNPKKRANVAGSLSGGNEIQVLLERDSQIEVSSKSPQYPLVLSSSKPLVINGNGVELLSNGGTGLRVTCSNVTIKDMSFNGFENCVRINGGAKAIENIAIENCNFKYVKYTGILTGASESNGSLKGLRVENCAFFGTEGIEEESFDNCTFSIELQAATSEGAKEINNALLEDVIVRGNRFYGAARVNVNMILAQEEQLVPQYKTVYNDCRLSNILVEENEFNSGWDAVINLITGCFNNRNSIAEDICIQNNKITFGVWGIFLAGGEPLFDGGFSENCISRNVTVKDNYLKLTEGGAGEPSAAIAINGARTDMGVCTVQNSGIQDYKIINNEILGSEWGIMVEGAHGMLDNEFRSEMSNCFATDVLIEGNQFSDVGKPFLFYGANLEGRRFDWNIGVPRRNKNWMPLRADHHSPSIIVENNITDRIVCKNNAIKGYRYMMIASGCKASGHAVTKGNVLGAEMVFENNLYEEGEGRIFIQNEMLEDWAQGEDNQVLGKFNPSW